MRLSPIFEAAFWKRGAYHSSFWDLLDSFEWAVTRDPKACGERHPNYANGQFWIWESPPISRLPRVFILYEIDEKNGAVIAWSYCLTPVAEK